MLAGMYQYPNMFGVVAAAATTTFIVQHLLSCASLFMIKVLEGKRRCCDM